MFYGFEIIDPNKLDTYNHPGVWAMFGVEKDKNPKKIVTCLNVGKNKCVGEELRTDYYRMKNYVPYTAKKYVNQFNEVKFEYDEYATRQDELYKRISEKYDSIITILVTKENLYSIEKYFAYSTKAEFWVSNARYLPETVVDNEKIETIRQDIDVSMIDQEIIHRIDKLKLWYENQINE